MIHAWSNLTDDEQLWVMATLPRGTSLTDARAALAEEAQRVAERKALAQRFAQAVGRGAIGRVA